MTSREENPYSAPADLSHESSARSEPTDIDHQPRPVLHGALFVVILAMWICSVFLAVTPNSKLHRMGIGNAIAIDLTLGVLVAFGIALVSLFARRTAPSSALFWTTQLLAWGHSVGIIALFAFAVIYALLHSGV